MRYERVPSYRDDFGPRSDLCRFHVLGVHIVTDRALRHDGLPRLAARKPYRDVDVKSWRKRAPEEPCRLKAARIPRPKKHHIVQSGAWPRLPAILPECFECCYDGHIGVVPTCLEHLAKVTLNPRRVDDI
jgi:hypothetical protein